MVQGSKKILEFQLALGTSQCISEILLSMGKTWLALLTL